MKQYLLTFGIVVSGITFAQNEDDVLRYSNLTLSGSARNLSLAGTISGLGGDFSAVQSNPAGLARMKKSTFVFTPYVEAPRAGSNFYGQENLSSGAQLKVGTISYVKSYELDPKRFNNWFHVQLGLGYERINSFENRLYYSGTADSSILNSFANEAEGTFNGDIYNAHPFRAGLAYDVYALDPGADDYSYVPTWTNGTVDHSRTTDQKGGMGEYNFVASGNYGDQLYIGGSLKFTRVKFTEYFTHRETYDESSNWLNSINYTGDLDIKGWGIGGTIGAMYVPQNNLRMGLSFQSATFYKLQDIWSNNMSSNTDDGDISVLSENVPYGKFDYRVKTPARLNANFTYIYEKRGAISAELEYIDYRKGRLMNISFSDNPADFSTENNQVDNIYTNALNVKLGGEIRLSQSAYFRAGYAYFPSPYKSNKGNQRFGTNFLTTGFGLNFGSYFVDLAYVYRRRKNIQYSYDPSIAGSEVTYTHMDSRVALTIGFRID